MRLLLLTIFIIGLNSECQNIDELCLACDINSTKCSFCAASYISNGSCVAPNTPINNCFTYNSGSECLECQYGYYVNNFGLCEEIPVNNCAVYNKSSQECTICKDKKQVKKDGSCSDQVECENSNCLNCEIIGSKTSCVLCDSGYMLLSDSGSALISTNRIYNCILETKSTKFCEIANTSNNDICDKCDACLLYTSPSPRDLSTSRMPSSA